MKKIGLMITILATALLTSCGGKGGEEGLSGLMNQVALKNQIAVTLLPSDTVWKTFGDISIALWPARTNYDTLMKSDQFMVWNFKIANHCTRVYKVDDITFSVDLEDHTYDFEKMYKRGFYSLTGYLANRDISNINVNPNHAQVITNKFVWSYDYHNQSREFGSPIKISLYNIPKCENGAISGHYNAEWNFEVKHR